MDNSKDETSGDVNKEVIQYILALLCEPKLKEENEIISGDSRLAHDAEFLKLCSIIMDIRKLSSALNKGDLQEFVKGKGFVLSNLKGLQANLRHLTWQTQKIAEGDFSPKVDFLGDFSEAFNAMTNKLKTLTNELVQLANFDFLTKLPNRMAVTGFLQNAFDDAKANGKPFSILTLDIDHFKNINDTYGHDVGDKILIQLSDILNHKFRSSDFLGRFGGEEFLVVMPYADLEMARKRGEYLVNFIENAKFMIDSKNSIKVTVSIGVSAWTPGDPDYDCIVKRSDEALYQAKREGRNRVCVL